jgi:hypothetical protein
MPHQRDPARAPAVGRHRRCGVVAGMSAVARIGIFLFVFGFAFALGCVIAAASGAPPDFPHVALIVLTACEVALCGVLFTLHVLP